MLLAVIIGIAAGLLIGFRTSFSFPPWLSFYITMALLAAADSVIGAVRAHMERKYSSLVFITGFITNSLIAAGFVFAGDKLGIPLYYAVIFVFGGRIINNVAIIRHIIIDKYTKRKKSQGTGIKDQGIRNQGMKEDPLSRASATALPGGASQEGQPAPFPVGSQEGLPIGQPAPFPGASQEGQMPTKQPEMSPVTGFPEFEPEPRKKS